MRPLASASGLASTSGRGRSDIMWPVMRPVAAQLEQRQRQRPDRRHRCRRRRLDDLLTSPPTTTTPSCIGLSRPASSSFRIAATGDDQPSFGTDRPAAPPTSSSPSSSSFATPAGRSLVELAAAWDALAPRLPAVSSAAAASSPDSSSPEGPGPAAAARVILDALKLAVSRAPPRPALPTLGSASDDSGGSGGGGGGGGSPGDGTTTTASSSSSTPPPPAALAASAALGTASRLADLASRGLPLDADAIAAGIVADAAAEGRLSVADAAARLGPGPAALLSDVLALRNLPRRADCYDDDAAARLREEALACYDGRAAMVEIARRAAAMSMGSGNSGNSGSRNGSNNNDTTPAPPASFSSSSTLVSPAAARQIAALESLQLYGPLGHALGMGPVAAELEDACLQEIFPSSYAETATWLRREAGAYRSALSAAAERLEHALQDHDARSGGELASLAERCEVVVRTKSLFSTMKKLLRLDDLSAGGREKGALFDLLGMRVVVHPREEGGESVQGLGVEGAAAEEEAIGEELEEDEEEEEETVVFSSGGAAAAAFPPPPPLPLPSFVPSPSQAEQDAIAACYLVRDVASSLWPSVPGRSKDYIARPKPNGYASLHLTVRPFGGAEAAVVDLRGKDDSDGDEEDGNDGSGFEIGSGYETDGSAEASSASEEGPALELQIRTARMHASAEFGEAAHTAYKGGLARERAAALAAWTAAAAASAASDWSSSSEDDDETDASSLPLPPLLPLSSASSSSSVSLLPSSSPLPPASPAWSKRRQAAAALFAHLDANGDGRVSVEELASALRDMSFSNDASSSEELSSVARKLVAAAKKGSSWLCSEEETEEEDSLSLEAFLEMMNQSGASTEFAPMAKEGAACIDSDDDED